ncbi:MAG TPA: energy transducer TonB, partial [Polyangiaceae bacterium]
MRFAGRGTTFAVLLALTSASSAFAQKVPPKVVEHADAVYPADLVAKGVHADVVLIVTIDAEGHVTSADVETSGGPELDGAAVDAMRRWIFDPATVDGKAVASKIRVPFHFAPPEPAPETQTQETVQGHVTSQTGSGNPTTSSPESIQQVPPSQPTKPPRKSLPPPPAEAGVEDVTVHGALEAPTHGASDMTFKPGELKVIPKKNAAALLPSAAPGILLTNEGGEGHAEQVFMRGFDAREGQDIEFTVGGVPINESGNLHGNGYSDTNFIIPELVQGFRLVEGTYDPHQGNYAVAGSAEFHLGITGNGELARG